jgi:hypothetical protein
LDIAAQHNTTQHSKTRNSVAHHITAWYSAARHITPLPIATFKKSITKGKWDLALRGVVELDPIMTLLVMVG